MTRYRLLLAPSLIAFALPSAAMAAGQERENSVGDGSANQELRDVRGQRSNDTIHRPQSAEIIVTGAYQRPQLDVLSGTSVLAGPELTRELRTTIGDTLAGQPGVSTTSFGPNASRPVLRGLQGQRVRVLTDGIGSFDVSNTSVDHAVAINPLTADRIEVLRGPSALLFGSSAIGGVVNVIDARIPREIPDEPIHIDALATYGSASDERSASASIDVPVGGKFVFHLDGSYSKTDDLETGGYVLSRRQRQIAAASGDADIAALADLKGTLPNSAAETWEVAGGVALITEGGNLGFSFGHLDNLYGVPVRYSLDPAVEAEEVRIGVRQDRADLRGEVEMGEGFFDKLRVRVGAADYTHEEIEESGEIGTTFLNQSLESRLELVQNDRNGWQGASGIQYFERDFNVIGEEKFVPKNDSYQFGLFTLQSLDLGKVRLEAGVRYEHSKLKARADADLGNPDIRRSFNAYSGSIGASYDLTDTVRIGLNLTHSERAPSAEELFPNGPHAGTQAFEIGDPDLGKEKSNGIEATLKGAGDGYDFGISAYYTDFADFIYEQETGAVLDDLPVYQFMQRDAEFYGLEAEASLRFARVGDVAMLVDGLADYTHATLKNAGPVPRIPPLRLLTGLEARTDRLQGRIEVEYVDDQDRVAAFETPSENYTMVNASAAFHPFGRDSITSVLLSANNIFDVEARRHASFLKDFAPLAGRDIRLTVRFSL